MTNIDYKDLVLEELNYNSYLRLPQILNLQHEISKPAHHDEMFFIIIHQSAELWFKLILHETDTLIEALEAGVVSRALKVLRRIRQVLGLQIEQIKLLSTLTPIEFAGFRNYLRPASGFQSTQYREIEFLFGIRDQFFLKFFDKMPQTADRLRELLKKPSVYDVAVRAMKTAGFDVPDVVLERDFSKPWEMNEDLVQGIRRVYENPQDNYHWVLLFETMLDVDQNLVLWRKNHAVMVSRTIGTQQGTGGSAGFNFLTSREDLKAFPELWEVRNHVGGDY